MYKTRLQELCHQRSWNLPKYSTTKHGLDHNPCFQATVALHDVAFTTLNLFRSSKEAQNDAARLAFEHFSSSRPNPPPPSRPFVSSSSDQISQVGTTTSVVKDDYRFRGQTPQVDAATSGGKEVFGSRGETTLINANASAIKDVCRSRGSSSASTLQMNIQRRDQTPQVSATSVINDDNRLRDQTLQVNATTSIGKDVDRSRDQTPIVNATSSAVKDVCKSRDTVNLYKNQLQIYAQKRNLAFPMYSCEREGPPHASRFKCKVTIGGQTFECQEFFPTLKEAEHGAAKVALMSLSSDAVQEDDSGFYKNLLQELAQKKGYALPVYHTNRSGEAHIPTFVSTVEVELEIFTGQEAKTKKQAEMSAAKVAYLTLKECKPTQRPTVLSAANQPQADNKSSSLQSNLNNDFHQKSQPTGHVVPSQSLVHPEESRVTGEASCQHLIDPFPQPVIDPNWKRESSPSDPPAPLTPDNTCPTSSLRSDFSANVVPESNTELGGGTYTSTVTRVRVCPCMPNMIFPRGSTLLRSDEKWVALKLESQSNQ
ncbi:double-stranded RNA-binding protein 1-like isoform X2 [Mangifera indica]|uniref:double-stranded RNA-binding protein 1-like isoform X2 n=1 Tax=Mangifera indica TaxID=29780 RepID=UPI001CF94DE3|nr:double-stranded RNA-binding protein 1-like isoform X2 [Mangifera indica]